MKALLLNTFCHTMCIVNQIYIDVPLRWFNQPLVVCLFFLNKICNSCLIGFLKRFLSMFLETSSIFALTPKSCFVLHCSFLHVEWTTICSNTNYFLRDFVMYKLSIFKYNLVVISPSSTLQSILSPMHCLIPSIVGLKCPQAQDVKCSNNTW